MVFAHFSPCTSAFRVAWGGVAKNVTWHVHTHVMLCSIDGLGDNFTWPLHTHVMLHFDLTAQMRLVKTVCYVALWGWGSNVHVNLSH